MIMKKVNVTKSLTVGAIGSFAAANKAEISRQHDLTPWFTNHWTSLGLCPRKMARGGNTTKYMKIYGPQFGYEFAHDGQTKGGNYINPRLVKVQ